MADLEGGKYRSKPTYMARKENTLQMGACGREIDATNYVQYLTFNIFHNKEKQAMIYKVNIDGFEGQVIEIKTSFFVSPKLLVNGQPAPKGSKRGEMLLKSNDGAEVVAKWKPQLIGFDVPQLVVNDKVISVVEPIKWYQAVWSGLSLILVFIGGALGAILGLIGFTVNIRIFRTEMNGALKYLVSAIVSVLAYVLYLELATIIGLLIQ